MFVTDAYTQVLAGDCRDQGFPVLDTDGFFKPLSMYLPDLFNYSMHFGLSLSLFFFFN